MVFDPGRKLRMGVIGMGGRGCGQMSTLLDMEDVDIVAVCDVYQDRVERAQKIVCDRRGTVPFGTKDYNELLARNDIEAVMITSSWTTHARIALAGLRAGKQVCMEVGGASSLEECWALVRASEETGLNCMMLENCCYDRNEMQILNMIKKGLFGEIIHCQGGYEHDLRDEIGNGDINRHYRQENFLHRNGELYPTHELGPICKYLDINRGNRMLSLVSMSSKARGLHEWLVKNRPGTDLVNAVVNEGDVVTTMIKCANGETIFLNHECTLPRPYSRGGRVDGTKGIWMEDNASCFLEGISPEDKESWSPELWEPLSNHYEKYGHPLWKAYEEYGLRGGHGGMDFLVLRAFVESVQNGRVTPIDVYDTAAWMSITCLSEKSIAMGSMPVEIPDFTNGRWIGREPAPVSHYSLDQVHEELF